MSFEPGLYSILMYLEEQEDFALGEARGGKWSKREFGSQSGVCTKLQNPIAGHSRAIETPKMWESTMQCQRNRLREYQLTMSLSCRKQRLATYMYRSRLAYDSWCRVCSHAPLLLRRSRELTDFHTSLCRYLYSGLVRRKNALAVLFLTMLAMAIISFQFFFWGQQSLFTRLSDSCTQIDSSSIRRLLSMFLPNWWTFLGRHALLRVATCL